MLVIATSSQLSCELFLMSSDVTRAYWKPRRVAINHGSRLEGPKAQLYRQISLLLTPSEITSSAACRVILKRIHAGSFLEAM